jgi:hypothetical protein
MDFDDILSRFFSAIPKLPPHTCGQGRIYTFLRPRPKHIILLGSPLKKFIYKFQLNM